MERRFSGGIYFLNSFTWSKAIDNASGHLEANNGDNSRVNYRDLRNERGPSGYDQRLNNVTTMLFDVPFGKGRKWSAGFAPANYALGGWRLALINTAQSGLPVNLSYSPSAQFQVSGAPTYRPNIIGNPLMRKGARTAERWLDPAAVVLPTDPSRPFGNAGRNAVRGPALHSLNFGTAQGFRHHGTAQDRVPDGGVQLPEPDQLRAAERKPLVWGLWEHHEPGDLATRDSARPSLCILRWE